MKITKSVPIENAEYIIALMDKLEFREIDRVATGGYMSPENLIITFEGLSDNYHERDYIKVEHGNRPDCTFISLANTVGYYGDLDGYRNYVKNNTKKFEILTL